MPTRIQNPIPRHPFYISYSDEVNAEWAQNFAVGLESIGLNYGVTPAKINEIKQSALVVKTIMDLLKGSKKYYAACIVCKNSYLDQDPEGPIGQIPWPEPFVAPALPAAQTRNILKGFIEVAELILMQNPPEADRITLGLVQAKGKALPPDHKSRQKVSDVDYPLLSFTITGDTIIITVKRGSIYRNKLLQLVVDKEGLGVYEVVGVTNLNTFIIRYTLPAGLQTKSWVFKGTFMEGQTPFGRWSPELVVTLTRPLI